MPAPGTITTDPRHQKMFDLLDGLSTGKSQNIATELELLRKEIEAMREELKPKPSIILTGDSVITEFEKLTHTNQLTHKQ